MKLGPKRVLTLKENHTLFRFWLCNKLGFQLAYNIKNESGKTHLNKANTFLGRNTKDFLVGLVQAMTSRVQHLSS
jgi:hypothetical protein